MKPNILLPFLTALLGSTGMQAWAEGLTQTEIDGKTYYEIATAEDLVTFADLVNEGESGANAILTADIALTDPWENTISGFTGIFDGQGHKITGFDAQSDTDGGGFFGTTNGATIQNFSISGTLTSTAGTGSGVVGYPSSSIIRNIHSSLDIDVPVSGVHHVGGVVGSARGGNTISGCTFSGTMHVAAGSTDNFAGVVSYLGGDSVVFCANYGTITFESQGCAAGGVAGYLNNTTSYVQGCLNMGQVILDSGEEEGLAPSFGGAIVGRLRSHDVNKLTGNCWLEGSATGAGKNDGAVNLTQATCFTAEQLPTGEIAFRLNGDQTNIGWYQTIGADEQPLLDNTHAQVYMVGRLHCNGDVYDDVSYTNDPQAILQDEHNIVDGFCSYCGIFDENYLTPNAEGNYEISTAGDLIWFEQKVNAGADTLNVVLTADIDFAEKIAEAEEKGTEFVWTPIGDWGNTRGTANAAYRGHFDGQGHTIRNLNATAKQNFFGLFGVISTGALIENFDIYGEFNVNVQYTGGAVAYARDGAAGSSTSPTIRNVHSFVNINNSSSGGRQGGILGAIIGNQAYVDGCTYSGTLDGNDSGGSGNYGGIVGYVNNDSKCYLGVTNCLFDGTVINNHESPGGSTFGGIVGYNNGGRTTIKNCLSIGTAKAAVYGQFFGKINGNNSIFSNVYYQGEFVNGNGSGGKVNGDAAIEVSKYDLTSGEICWKLNEESFVDPIWHQTIEEEDYPLPYGDGAIVFQTANGYACISDDGASFDLFQYNVIATETDFIENTVAYTALLEEYADRVSTWEDIDNLDDFMAAYKASLELKEAIKTSAANYVAYVNACEAAATYMEENGLEGEWADLLKEYLEGTIEPNNDYPNGSYAYIMENCQLDDKAITDEIAFVNQLLENAIAGGITSGTEITRLLVNPTFADKFEGWDEAHDGGSATVGGKTEIMPIAETYNNNSSNVSQTLTEMPNGIYVMDINGLFRSSDDIYSQFYAGQLYLNNTVNYFMSIGEDAIPEDEAEPNVNCLGEGSDAQYLGDIIGWVPTSRDGCSYAFKAGRYQNFCATEVTDGTLTVGMRNLGTGQAKDWMPFGGLHVYYMGTAEEANEKLADVLEGYVARAQTIVDFFWSEDESFVLYPNISTALQKQLQEAINGVEGATDGEKKIALINVFSDLFNQVYDCRKAYITMLDKANAIYDIIDGLLSQDFINEEDYNKYSELALEAQGGYISGNVSTEEALALAEQLDILSRLIPSVNGVYQLATTKHLQLFSLRVSAGESNAKAVLTADIDMKDIENFDPIGIKDAPFSGEFDGQNHKILNYGIYQYGEEDGVALCDTATLSGDMRGFFGYAKNATIQNFSISGALNYNGGTGYGAIGWAEGTTFRNVHSTLDIASVSTSHHIGGICGHMADGSKAYNCSFSGTIIDKHNSYDCIGGIGGYSNTNCAYENCADYGDILFTASNAYASGICGYVNNDNFVGVKNSLSVGTIGLINGGTPTYSGAIIGRLRSHANSKFENNYWLEGSAAKGFGENNEQSTTVTDAQLKSGEICYKLNGDQSEINWYQTLATDDYPVLWDSSLQVWLDDETYTNVDPDGIHDIKADELPAANNGIYNLAGQRLEKLQRGINIVNGKKVLVK